MVDWVANQLLKYEARIAHGYRLGKLLRFFRALRTSRVLHNSIVHAKHEPIVTMLVDTGPLLTSWPRLFEKCITLSIG